MNEIHDDADRGRTPTGWTFLTNHAHVMICLFEDPHIRVRDIAERVGITQRAVQRIVTELEDGGVITRRREGRRNVYEINESRQLRHPVESHRTVGDLLHMVEAASPATTAGNVGSKAQGG